MPQSDRHARQEAQRRAQIEAYHAEARALAPKLGAVIVRNCFDRPLIEFGPFSLSAFINYTGRWPDGSEFTPQGSHRQTPRLGR